MKMKDVLFIPRLKKNLLSRSALDAKGMGVAFVDGQVLIWHKGNTIDDATVIGEQDEDLYKLKGQNEKALVHDSLEPIELWHRRLAHVHYRALPIERKESQDFQKSRKSMKEFSKYVCKERMQRRHFPVVIAKKKEYWR